MSALYNGTFSSIVADIKSFAGTDPLLPWLRGIRKMKETLPPQVLNDKLPRFLQRCAETFLNDQRYADDLRYLRVWLQLMDFVDDPKAILKKMELNHIGTRSSLFYEAYALYYEKQKKFDAANRIYLLGVENFAEPADRLQKSFAQFLHRKGHHMKNKQKSVRNRSEKNTNFCSVDSTTNHGPVELTKGAKSASSDCMFREPIESSVADGGNIENSRHGDENSNVSSVPRLRSDDPGNVASKSSIHGGFQEETVVYRFVGSTILNEPEVENFRHHGLVDPTVNMKEAMEDINGMFGKPIEFTRKSRRRRQEEDDDAEEENCGEFLILPDDQSDDANRGGFVILADEESDEDGGGTSSRSDGNDLFEPTICTKEAMADINKLFAMPI